MKIKHIVVPEAEEVDKLFNLVMEACLTVYSSPDEQAAALVVKKGQFTDIFSGYMSDAFKLGKKLGKIKADSKDDAMYQQPDGVVK